MGHWSQSVGERERLWVAGVRLWGGSGMMGNWSEIVGQRMRLWGGKWDYGELE